MQIHEKDTLRKAVRNTYGEIARRGAAAVSTDTEAATPTTAAGCCVSGSGCCTPGTSTEASWADAAVSLGYSPEDVASAPASANLGLGCGNPQAIAALQPGEAVLDLGSGGGFDSFLAAGQVGSEGSVIGVDMTPDMVEVARRNTDAAGVTNVEFRLGEIERLPVADQSIDVIMSNCVINLSPDKPSVFREAFRVLKEGGRLAITDIVASAPLPDHLREDLALYTGCMAGASDIERLQQHMEEAGFTDISITPKEESRTFIRQWAPEHDLEDVVVSAVIQAKKPVAVEATACCTTAERAVCCEPEARDQCCGSDDVEACGCL